MCLFSLPLHAERGILQEFQSRIKRSQVEWLTSSHSSRLVEKAESQERKQSPGATTLGSQSTFCVAMSKSSSSPNLFSSLVTQQGGPCLPLSIVDSNRDRAPPSMLVPHLEHPAAPGLGFWGLHVEVAHGDGMEPPDPASVSPLLDHSVEAGSLGNELLLGLGPALADHRA